MAARSNREIMLRILPDEREMNKRTCSKNYMRRIKGEDRDRIATPVSGAGYTVRSKRSKKAGKT